MNRTLRGIGAALCLMTALLVLLGRRFDIKIKGENFGLLSCLLLFSGLMLMIWFAPKPHRTPGRIAVWVMTLYTSWGVSVTPLIRWIPYKAILIFLALALLVVSEWRYAHPSAEQRMAGSLEGTVKTTTRNLLIWLAVTTSLVLIWRLIRLIL